MYDLRPEAADGLAGVPAQLRSPAEVAELSDVVLVAVVDADQARTALTGEDGLLTRAHPGLVVVLLSTVAVPVVHELAGSCAAAGASLLDCGVTPGNKAAENGMVAIVGGPDDVVAAARPVLDDFAKTVVHCGPLGAGMATKIARNVVTYGSWRAVREAAALTEAAGVPPSKLLDVLEAADADGALLLTLLRLHVAGHDLGPSQAAAAGHLLEKDLDAAQDLAGTFGVDVPLIDVTRDTGGDAYSWPEVPGAVQP